MMRHRETQMELTETQLELRKKILHTFFLFDENNLLNFLDQEIVITDFLKVLTDSTINTADNEFFRGYSSVVQSIFHLVKWSFKELQADPGSSAHLQAGKRYACLVNLNAFDHIPEFKNEIAGIVNTIEQITSPSEIKALITKFIQIAFPIFFSFERIPFEYPKIPIEENEGAQKNPPNILSIELTIEKEPWSNPHILKPNVLYSINGVISMNYWPSGYQNLILYPVSILTSDLFSLSFTVISFETGVLNYDISGNVLFKYAQSGFDDTISIRLLARFHGTNMESLYPTVIGYNQLISKVVDTNSPFLMTGYKTMNKIVFDLMTDLSTELPELDITERDNFVNLLSGILNYQGFCTQHGSYKNINSLKESEFRDRMIQHLVGIHNLGEEIVKESHVAGGLVEISYRGIIAELKVESVISDREQLIKKYGKQPIQYASGNAKQLSILCILDLSEKKLPPAPPQNNVKIITPELHGFEDSKPKFPSKLAIVIIDGNTKSPSDYSAKQF